MSSLFDVGSCYDCSAKMEWMTMGNLFKLHHSFIMKSNAQHLPSKIELVGHHAPYDSLGRTLSSRSCLFEVSEGLLAGEAPPDWEELF